MLTESDKRYLLRAARMLIENAVTGSEPRVLDPAPSSLTRPSGAFVTLHSRGELRGCIGYVDPLKPVVEIVRECAVKAALDDPRFPRVASPELQSLEIEISVLSALARIRSIDEVELGIHGLVVETHHRRGVLLPQVAIDHGWTRDVLLQQALLKAGIVATDKFRMFTFTADVFSERSIAMTGS